MPVSDVQLIRSGTFEDSPEGPGAQRIDPDSAEAQESEDAPIQTERIVRQIPDEMWREVEQDISMYIQDELTDARSERSQFVDKVARWKDVYRAPPADEPKHFPIWNASNITVPIVKESVNTIAAQIAQSVLVARPRWVLKDLAEEWRPFIEPLEDFLDIASDRDMDIERRAVPWIIETAKLGTGIMDTGWKFRKVNNYRYTPDGKKVYPKDLILEDGPKPEQVAIQDLWIRFDQTDIHDTRWVSRRLWMSEKDLRDALARKEMFALQNISGQTRMVRDLPTSIDQEIERTRPVSSDLFEVFKIFLYWDIDGDGVDEELLLHYSLDARQFLSKRFTPFWHGRRPFTVIRYFPVEHRFYGMGLCEMLEEIQQAISDDFNKRADNQTLANASMIIKRKLAKGLMPGDPLYAAKIIETSDIWNDIREFRISEPYPSTVQEISILRKMGDDLSGISDAQRGSALPVTRTTAAAQLSLLQEQATRISLTVQDMRAGLDEIGWLATNLYYQFGLGGRALAWMGERGRVVEALFRLPRRVAEIGQALRANTPTSAVNRQVKRENAIALFNLMTQLYQQLLPLVGQMAPESAPEVVEALVKSSKRFMEDVLGTFDVTDPEEVLSGLTTLERVLPVPEDMGGMGNMRRMEESQKLIERMGAIEALYDEASEIRKGDRDPTRTRIASPREPRLTPGNGRDQGVPLGDGGRVPPFIGPTAQPPQGPGRGV